MHKMSNETMDILVARFNSFEVNGLNLTIHRYNGDYLTRYHGSLIGKHFKALIQAMVFVAYDLISEDLLIAWKCLGRMGVLMWETCISNTHEYTVGISPKVAMRVSTKFLLLLVGAELCYRRFPRYLGETQSLNSPG